MTKLTLKPFNEEPDPELDYPSKETPHTAIVINLNEEQYTLLHHTGRYFHGQCVCAGFDGEEIGISDVPTDPGIWMFVGEPWSYQDWETGVVDDYGIAGRWRKATMNDFVDNGLEIPWTFE